MIVPTNIILLMLSHPEIDDSKKRSNICQNKFIGFSIKLIAAITTVTIYFLLLKKGIAKIDFKLFYVFGTIQILVRATFYYENS